MATRRRPPAGRSAWIHGRRLNVFTAFFFGYLISTFVLCVGVFVAGVWFGKRWKEVEDE